MTSDSDHLEYEIQRCYWDLPIILYLKDTQRKLCVRLFHFHHVLSEVEAVFGKTSLLSSRETVSD